MTAAIDTMIPLFGKTMRGLLAVHMKNFGFKDREVNVVAHILETPTKNPSEAFWIGLIDIEELMQYDPRSFALIMLAGAHRISKTGYQKGALGCSEEKIRSLLQDVFPATIEYEKEILRIAELALCGCGDPELMIADVVNSPEDNTEKLAALAPCLKLGSPVDPSDLPIPSPFSP